MTKWTRAAAGLALFLSCFIAATGWLSIDVTWNVRRQAQTQEVIDGTEGPQGVLVFVGASTCGASTVPEMPQLLQVIRESVAKQFEAAGYRAVSVGLAKDSNVKAGLRYLERFGEFTEVATGAGWLGVGVSKYVIADHPGALATPQVVVLTRDVASSVGSRTIARETVMLRKRGLSELRAWQAAGAPLPAITQR